MTSDTQLSTSNRCSPSSPASSPASSKDTNNGDPKARTNYIFVDYENVQDLDLDLIAGKAVKVLLIIGKRRKTLPCEPGRQVHEYSKQVEWIELEGAAPNALDLVLAYRLGLQAKADPQGFFHVLAKDKDYDALIKHLRASGVLASRGRDICSHLGARHRDDRKCEAFPED